LIKDNNFLRVDFILVSFSYKLSLVTMLQNGQLILSQPHWERGINSIEVCCTYLFCTIVVELLGAPMVFTVNLS